MILMGPYDIVLVKIFPALDITIIPEMYKFEGQYWGLSMTLKI